jgi:asparagine synthase (glutamine-hydrolysing)
MTGVFGIVDREHRMNLSKTAHDMASALSHYPWFVTEYTTDDEQAVVLGRVGIGIFNQETQPLWNSNHTIALVMAGEFYYQDSLRKDIVSKAMSDEQIALAMYEQYGEDFACHLRGIFIIAVWDAEQQRVIVTNDRFGLYPLYYSCSQDKLVFAPEVKAILADPDFCKRLDMGALAEYIRFQCLLGDKTFFEDLQLLPNASIFVYSLETGSLSLRSYWDISHLPSLPTSLTFNEAVREAGRLLKVAVDRRTSGPYQLGLYLSAGVDSRVIMGLIDQDLFPIPSITFGQQNCRDVIYAQNLAKKAGTQHHYFEFYGGKWVEEFADLHLVLTEGFHSWIHAHGISFLSQVRPLLNVNLTGFGGGQSAIDWEDLSLLEAQDDTAFSNRLFELLCQNTTWPSVSEAEAKSLYMPSLAKKMDELVFSSFKAELDKFQRLPYYQRAAYFALCNPDRRLFQYYTVFHRSHFEQRFPFYDYDYFEFVYSLPPAMLFHRKLRRAIILEMTPALAHVPYDKDDLPITNNNFFRLASKVAQRSKKWINETIRPVFPAYTTLYADYENWLRHELREWGESILLGERTLQRDIFNPESLRSLWRRHQSGLELHTIGKIAPIMTYEMMLRRFYDEG